MGMIWFFLGKLLGKVQQNDIFLCITTSVKSPNILKALEQCKILGIPTIIFSGKGGGAAKKLADYAVIVPGVATSTIQELHIVLAHTLCESVENAIFSNNQ